MSPSPLSRPVVIGLAGGSGSGKSTVLSQLQEAWDDEGVSVLDHDAYYRELTHLSVEDRASFNFDHPAALETELLVKHLEALLQGFSIEKPVYDFTTHSRTERTVTVRPTPVIVVEGILVLAEKDLVDRMDIKLFVDTDDDVRLIRRIRRDMEERGRSLDSILEQYERTVRPMHIEFVQPSRRMADVIIPRGGRNEIAVQMVLSRISTILAGR
ncbi:MAG: uridine kinase [Rhodothermales bacterium]